LPSFLRLNVDPERPDMAIVERAAASILNGRLVAMPTDTLYGLAADPFNSRAVARVFEVKGRAAARALPLVAADSAQIRRWLGELPAVADRLATRFWPGPLTLLVTAPETLATGVTGGTGVVGVRVPAHAVTRALCAAADRPLTATSANLSGQPATDDPSEVAASLGARVDVLLDAGRTPGGAPSTIIDITGAVPRLVRAGAIPWDAVQMAVDRA
jgi:L-threonylcarbamoyladenylate synthase